jgi:hypothetical protein
MLRFLPAGSVIPDTGHIIFISHWEARHIPPEQHAQHS